MTKTKHFGVCRLCGVEGKLTFEHIPPRKAFNDQPRVFEALQDHLRERGKTKFRRGFGAYCLCERCNNITGAWYGSAFVEWTRQGMEQLDRLPEGVTSELPFDIKPVNVLKQILVMTIDLSTLGTMDYHRDLRKFLLDRTSTSLPPKYAVYAYFNSTGQPRFASEAAVANKQSGRVSYVEAEVCLPPFGYCVIAEKNMPSLADEQGLTNITWFSKHDYDARATVYVRLPVLETYSPFPLLY